MENQEPETSPSEDEAAFDSFSEALDNVEPASKSSPADQAKIEALQSDLDRVKDQLMRALAETENTRRRAKMDREDASKFAITSFAKDLLSVSDNLRRALEAIPQELMAMHPEVKNLADGIEATERQLLRSFEKNNIKKLVPIDMPFDPHFHEVMFEAPIPGKTAGTVIQVVEPGYTLNDRILRPARVGIAKDTGNGGTPPSPPEGGHHIDTQA
ncbi:MAG: nucleotide exchange factor GrpE [Alphaproteobacteria bacterium]|nr:nucleotide exchange factor GrpE [Alphaproteobacteria bacterium]